MYIDTDCLACHGVEKICFEQENLERKKAEYVEKMKNKVAEIHRLAEEKRANVEAQKREEFLELEETAAKFRSRGVTPRKFFACFSA